MAGIEDLMELTGLGRQAVAGAIDRGELPGYRVGAGRRFWIPDEALEMVRTGTWISASQRTRLNISRNPFLKNIPKRVTPSG